MGIHYGRGWYREKNSLRCRLRHRRPAHGECGVGLTDWMAVLILDSDSDAIHVVRASPWDQHAECEGQTRGLVEVCDRDLVPRAAHEIQFSADGFCPVGQDKELDLGLIQGLQLFVDCHVRTS